MAYIIELTAIQAKLVTDIEKMQALIETYKERLAGTGVTWIQAKRAAGLAPIPGPKPDSIGAAEYFEHISAAAGCTSSGSISRAEVVAIFGGNSAKIYEFTRKGFLVRTEEGFAPGTPPGGRKTPSEGPMTAEEAAFFATLRGPGDARKGVGPRRFQRLVEGGAVIKYETSVHGSYGVPGLTPTVVVAAKKVAKAKADEPALEGFDSALEEDETPMVAREQQTVVFG